MAKVKTEPEEEKKEPKTIEPLPLHDKPVSSDDCTPISHLQVEYPDWRIKARVVFKSNVKQFGVGKRMFTIYLLDANRSMISGAFFDTLCDDMHPLISSG